MAAAKKTQNKTNTSGKTRASGKSTRKKKNTSDDSMKFLLVLVIAGIAIALIFFSQPGNKEQGENKITGTPTPTAGTEAGNTPSVENVGKQEQTNPTQAPAANITATPVPTETPLPTSTPTPTPALSAQEAENVVLEKVDTTVYNVQLVNANLLVGNGSYYQFGAIKEQEFVYPFFVVNKADGTLYYYNSTEDTVFDFTKFPLEAEATPTPVPTSAPAGKITAKEAYQVLCAYSKESLHTAKEVSAYDAEYGNELTLINGVDCYRINLSEFSNGKKRNRGEFYISVDGLKCYYIDSDTNEFVEAKK